jgi:hypothetical protein
MFRIIYLHIERILGVILALWAGYQWYVNDCSIFQLMTPPDNPPATLLLYILIGVALAVDAQFKLYPPKISKTYQVESLPDEKSYENINQYNPKKILLLSIGFLFFGIFLSFKSLVTIIHYFQGKDIEVFVAKFGFVFYGKEALVAASAIAFLGVVCLVTAVIYFLDLIKHRSNKTFSRTRDRAG